MAAFEEQRRRRTEPPAAREAAPEPPREAQAMLALQRGAGNAAVTAWLARQPVATDSDPITTVIEELLGRDAVVSPHAGGAAEGLAAALAGAVEAGAEALDWLEQALGFAGPAGGPPAAPVASPPTPDKAVSDWHTRTLTTNADHAQWILDGEGLGFVTFTAGMGSKAQMTDLAAGKKVSGVDPGQSALLGSLFTIHAIVDGRAAHWLADPSQAKTPLMVGSFIRTSGHRGESIDINGLDWTGPAGPGQVAALLQELPKGSYGIGLPFQGDFFPAGLELARRMQAAQAKAGAGTPDPVTDPSLQRWVTGTYTAAWNAAKTPAPGWDIAGAGGSAVTHLRSAALKTAIHDLNAAGYSIYVFPDNDNHIHIQH